MEKLFKSYLNKLVNLSGNNRSLLLLKTFKNQDIDLKEFDFELNDNSFSIVESLLYFSKSIPLTKVIDSRDGESNSKSKILKNIFKKERVIFEERGAKDLYVGWPFVEGSLLNSALIRCPLLLFPVELETNTQNQWVLKIRKEIPISFNKNFLLAYSFFNQTAFDEKLADTNFENFDTDSTVFITQLYQLLKESNVELNFNSLIFTKKLEKLVQYTKQEFESKTDLAELKLQPNAVLGFFPQNSSYFFPDYQVFINENSFESIDHFFKSKQLNLDVYKQEIESKEQHTLTVFDIDASQEKVLKEVKKGNSLVVQGPPGTGKSQLICNIIADYTARGKKVLVVCQKKAALDVVYNRINTKNFSEFVGLVHDLKLDRKSLFEQISNQIDKVENYEINNLKLNSVILERNFLEHSIQIEQITHELDEFKKALFDTSECGISVKELYLSSNRNVAKIDVKPFYANFPPTRFTDIFNKIKSYLIYAEPFENKEYILRDRVSFAEFSTNNLQEIQHCIDEITRFKDELKIKTKSVLIDSISFEECEWVFEKKNVFEKLFLLLQNEEVFNVFKLVINEKNFQHSSFYNTTNNLLKCFENSIIETTIEKQNLGKVHQTLQYVSTIRNNPFKWLYWKLFSKDKYLLNKILVSNNLKWDTESFKILKKKIDNRLNIEHNLSVLYNYSWIQTKPTALNIDKINEWLNVYISAVEAFACYDSLRGFKNFFNFNALTLDKFSNQITELFQIIGEVRDKRTNWNLYFKNTEINKLLNESYSFIELYKHQLEQDFDSLCAFDSLLKSLSDPEQKLITSLIEHTNSYDNDLNLKLIEHNLKLAWIDHIERKYSVLRIVTNKKLEQLEKDLIHHIKEKNKISNEILLLKLKENTYKHLEYNRLNNRVSFRKLKHQTVKKKKIWSIRKLIAKHYDELFDLIPCWLSSPETVSSIFPTSELFDLVIFDEASQCYAEKAIPSLFRAKQFVVIGDDKQLAPNDLYQLRWESEEENELPEIEAESILQLSSMYLKSMQLQYHYRSNSLDLIDFSNKHFYNGNLFLLPNYESVESEKPAIDYIHINNGIWEKNTNIQEALKIQNIVFELIENDIFDIGVVTFNYHQQDLIYDLIHDYALQNGIDLPTQLFVKNIENVQGDERDIILFSIGYAKNTKGKILNFFGSLNMLHGENRLNVAITRARKKIIIVSSILPHELDVTNAKHEGPKLLKSYLSYSKEVSEGKFTPTIKSYNTFENSVLLKNKLLQINSEFKIYLPFADITFLENNIPKLVIFTDDDLFYQHESTKETFAYLPMQFEQKKWKYKRQFSRNFWLNNKNNEL